MATQAPSRPASTQTQGTASSSSAPIVHAGREVPAPQGHAVDPNAFPEAFAEIDALAAGTLNPKPQDTPKVQPKAPAKPAAPKAPEQKPAPTPPAKPAEKPAEKPTEPEAKPETQPEPQVEDENPAGKFQLAHDLRKEYNKQYREIRSLKAEVEELRTKSTLPENNQQTSALVEENKQLKKRLEEVDQDMRYMDYTRSQEFKDKFEKPLQNALADAYEEIKEFGVQMEDGSTRVATERDFNEILSATPEQVRKLARDKFGEFANDVLAMRRRVVDIRRAADRESSKYREEAKTRESQRVAKEVQERELQDKLWQRANSEVVTKYPQYFGKVEGDDELNSVLQKGYELVKLAHDPNLSLEERVERRAVGLHKQAAFGAMQLRLKRSMDRVKELEGIVAEYEKSEPGEGKVPSTSGETRPTNGAPEGYEDVDSAIGRMPRIAA